MKYRILGKTGLKVSVVGVGTWQFGGDWGKEFTQDEVNSMLSRARQLGINLIDTAACYGGDHVSEKLIGGFLADENREDWVVATKFGHRPGWSADDVLQTLEDCLDALQTDYIDVFQFHSGSDTHFDNPELWDMLNEQVDAGKVRYLGNSLGLNDPSVEQVRRADEFGLSEIQLPYNLLRRGVEEEILPLCQEKDLGVLARTPLESGFLTGKYGPDAEFPESDVRSNKSKEQIRQMGKAAQHIKAEEVPEGVPMVQYALGWILKHPAVTCVIPGCKSVGQVESNAAAADLDIVPDDHPQAAG